MAYSFLAVVIIFNFLGMFYIYKYLKRLQNINLLAKTKIFHKLIWYPIIFTIMWAFPIVNRFSTIIFGYRAEWAFILHMVFLSLMGFCNTMLYALSPKVKILIKEKIRKLFMKKKIEATLIDLTPIQQDKVKEIVMTQMTTENDEEIDAI